MENSINQLYTLFVFIISGSIIGILFDLFRILRKSFKTPDIITYIEDTLFWIITGLFLLYIIFTYSYGEIRIYMFISLIIGLIIYFFTISKYFIKINVKIITFFKTIISKILFIILFPVRFLFKILRKTIFKPVSFCIINIRKNFTNCYKKVKKNIKANKNIAKKSKKIHHKGRIFNKNVENYK